MRYRAIACLFAAGEMFCAALASAEAVKVMDFNLLNYNNPGTAQYLALKRIVQAMNPKVCLFEEAADSSGRNQFASDFAAQFPYTYLDPSSASPKNQIWSAYPITNKGQIWSKAYNGSTFSRPVIWADLDVLPGESGSELRVYCAHWKAYPDDPNSQITRLNEATDSANHIVAFIGSNPTARFLYAGDLNDFIGTPPLNKILEPQTTLSRLTIVDPNTGDDYTYWNWTPPSILDYMLYSATLNGLISGPMIFHTETYPPGTVPPPALSADSQTASDHLALVAILDIQAAGNVPPSITQQPVPVSVCPGGTASFDVTATGTPAPTYQWRKDGAPLSDGGRISGATTPHLTISSVQSGDAGNYDVVVTNVAGSVTSTAVGLTVKAAPAITQQPAPASICTGDTANFNVTASGTPAPSYQWRKGGAALSNGGRIAGATSANLTITSVLSGDADSYDVVVTNDCGTQTSTPVALTVKVAPAISTHPTDQAVLVGGTASFSVVASGSGTLGYQWSKDGIPLTDGGHIAGATSANLTISNCSPSDAGAYAVAVSGDCGQAGSNSATLTVNQPVHLTQWRSVRSHSGIGALPIVLDGTRSGNGGSGPTVETRGTAALGMGVRLVQVDFDAAVTLVDPGLVTVTCWPTIGGALGSPFNPTTNVSMAGASTLSIALPDAPDEACCFVSIAFGALAEEVAGECMVRALVGDANGSGNLSMADSLLIKSKVGQAASSFPHLDCNLSGAITMADALLAKSRIGKQALCP